MPFTSLVIEYIPAFIALVSTNTPEKEVGYALGVMSTATAAGSILGPLFGGVLSHWVGTRECFMVSGYIVFISAVIALVGVKEVYRKTEGSRPSVLQDLKQETANKRLMWIFGMTLLVATSVNLGAITDYLCCLDWWGNW